MTIHRVAYLRTIRERLRDNPIVSLVGPRQAGKTTLARMLAAQASEDVHFLRFRVGQLTSAASAIPSGPCARSAGW